MSIQAKRIKFLDLETNVPVADFFGVNHNDILNGSGEFLTKILGGVLPDANEVINDLGGFFKDFTSFDTSQITSLVGSEQLRGITSSLNSLFPTANVSISDLDNIKTECLGYIYDELRRCKSFSTRFSTSGWNGGSGYTDKCDVDAMGAIFGKLGKTTFNYTRPLQNANNPYANYNQESCEKLAYYAGLLKTSKSLGIEGTDAVTAQLSPKDQLFLKTATEDFDFKNSYVADEDDYSLNARPGFLKDGDLTFSKRLLDRFPIYTITDWYTVLALLNCKFFPVSKTPFIMASVNMDSELKTRYVEASLSMVETLTADTIGTYFTHDAFIETQASICDASLSLPNDLARAGELRSFIFTVNQELIINITPE